MQPRAPGISLRGDDLTLANSTAISPRGADGDGIRFWGNNITITHNTIRDTRNLNGAHADCMQTFATDEQHVASQHVLIEYNRCERISKHLPDRRGPEQPRRGRQRPRAVRGLHLRQQLLRELRQRSH